MIITNLLANMLVLNASSLIPTNTPAFQDYAIYTMTTNAQALAKKWDLNFEGMGTNAAVSLKFQAGPWGIRGGLTMGGRYYFGADLGRFVGFSDEFYNWKVFECWPLRTNIAFGKLPLDQQLQAYKQAHQTNDVIAKQWMQSSNVLTMKKAEVIAVKALESAGVLVKQMGYKRTSRQQQEYETEDEQVFRLPYYRFEWESTHGKAKVDVSGVTSNIVLLQLWGRGGKLARPTNYYQLLGIPDNVVFVKRKYDPGPIPAYEVLDPQPPKPGSDN